MQYARKLILHAPPWDSPLLSKFVEKCLQDKVALICVIGDDCERVHDVIDELLVGDGSHDRELPATTWHEHETLPEVWNFAASWKVDGDPSAMVAEIKILAP